MQNIPFIFAVIGHKNSYNPKCTPEQQKVLIFTKKGSDALQKQAETLNIPHETFYPPLAIRETKGLLTRNQEINL